MYNKAVVTGASGHIGFHVASCLLNKGFAVTLLIRKENSNISILKTQGAITVVADLKNPITYSQVFDETAVLFHLASENTTDTSDEERVVQNTAMLTQTVIETALAQKVKTIIYTSSVVVLGRSSGKSALIDESGAVKNPESPYVKGKLLADKFCEKLIQEQKADIRRIYPSWIIGSHNIHLTPPHKTIQTFLNKGQLFYFSGGISIANVEEVAKAHVDAFLIGKPGEKYIVAGNNLSFREFYTQLANLTGRKPPKFFIPKWFLYAASVLLKKIPFKQTNIDPKYIKAVIGKYSWYTSAKAQKELGYSIAPATVTLKSAINDIKKGQYQLDKLVYKEKANLARIFYDEQDILLITGFPGWLGNRFVDVLMNGDTNAEHAIKRKVRLFVQPHFKGLIQLSPDFEIVYGDLSNVDDLKKALKGIKAVYHLAGVIYPKKISDFYKINFKGTQNLVDACIECGVRRILFMSTDSVCGFAKTGRIFTEATPAVPYKNYGNSKFLAEKYLLQKTQEGLIDGTSLRGFWFFGPFAPERNKAFFKMFKWKRQIVFGNGKNFRSISHIDNVIQAFLKAEKNKQTFGKWYWIGDEKADYTVNEIYTNIAEGMGVTFKPFYIHKCICSFLSCIDSMLGKAGILNATIHAAGKFHLDIAGDITAAKRDFNYTPNMHFNEIKNELKEINN